MSKNISLRKKYTKTQTSNLLLAYFHQLRVSFKIINILNNIKLLIILNTVLNPLIVKYWQRNLDKNFENHLIVSGLALKI